MTDAIPIMTITMISFFNLSFANRKRLTNAIAIKMNERKASEVNADLRSSYKA